MLSVVKAFLPSRSVLSLHQSQLALPAWIQLVSTMFDSGLRLVMTFYSTSFPGVSPTRRTRQALWCGSAPEMQTSEPLTSGAMRDSSEWPDQLPEGFVRYIAALS